MHETMHQSALITPDELYGRITMNDPFMRLLDASYVLPGDPFPPKTTYETKRIGDAQFFDIDQISDKNTDLPHMLPRPEEFADAVGKMGISNEHQVIIYGQENIMMGPARAWWMFRVFGHKNVFLLNCSLNHWDEKVYPVMRGEPTSYEPATFKPEMISSLVVSYDAIEALSASKIVPVYDARPHERFNGEAPEPREGIPSGHIPGSINVPASSLINSETGGLKEVYEYQHMFAKALDTPQKNPVMMCGSGVTACLLALAFYEMGYPKARIYDGSWAEWAKRNPSL